MNNRKEVTDLLAGCISLTGYEHPTGRSIMATGFKFEGMTFSHVKKLTSDSSADIAYTATLKLVGDDIHVMINSHSSIFTASAHHPSAIRQLIGFITVQAIRDEMRACHDYYEDITEAQGREEACKVATSYVIGKLAKGPENNAWLHKLAGGGA